MAGDPGNFRQVISSAVHGLLDRWRTVLSIHLLYTLMGIILLTPLFAGSLQLLVALSGNAAVADQDIAMLVLSPLGMIAAIALVALLLAIAGLEMAALQAVAGWPAIKCSAAGGGGSGSGEC